MCTSPFQPLTTGCGQGNESEEKYPQQWTCFTRQHVLPAPREPPSPEGTKARSDSRPEESRPRLAPSLCQSWLVGGGTWSITRSSPRPSPISTDLGCCRNPFSLCLLLKLLCQHLLLIFRLLWVTSEWRGEQELNSGQGQCCSVPPHQSTCLGAPTARDCSTHLDIFRRLRSSALAFWAKVRLSASARLSTAMARKTLRRISGGTALRTCTWFPFGGCGQSCPWPPGCPEKPSWS